MFSSTSVTGTEQIFKSDSSGTNLVLLINDIADVGEDVTVLFVTVLFNAQGIEYDKDFLGSGESMQTSGPGSLEDYSGELSAGPWTLSISDDALDFDGTLNEWYLVTACPSLGVNFKRGDATGDGSFDIADKVFILEYLFVAGSSPGCLDAADFNDSDQIDLVDAILLLRWLFTFGPPPAYPGPDICGPDPDGQDSLGCEIATDGCM